MCCLLDLLSFNTQTFEWMSGVNASGTVPPDRGLHAAVQRGSQVLVFGGLNDTVVRSFEVEGKGTQTQLQHLNDLNILEICES